MFGYIVRRLLWAIPVLLLVTAMTFALVDALPWEPFNTNRAARLNPQVKKNLEKKYGLDKPTFIPKKWTVDGIGETQYIHYITNAVRGDLGASTKSASEPVMETTVDGSFPFIHVEGTVPEGFHVSFVLGFWAFVTSALIGTVAGVISALWVNRWIDHALTVTTSLAFAVPAFVIATLWVFYLTDFAGWDTMPERVGPIAVLALAIMPYFTRLVRASMLESLQADYITTAKSKGLPWRTTVVRHALRNSMIPMVTNAGPVFGFVITGSFIIEKIMDVPGLGREFVTSFNAPLDRNMILGTTVLLSVVIVVVNLIVDVIVAVLDPRVTHD